MTVPQETLVWRGRPSEWTHAGRYFVCSLLAAADVAAYILTNRAQPLILAGLGVPFLLGLVTWARTRAHVYELTTQRLREIRGLFSRTTSEIELYRIRDYTVVEPLHLRVVGCGTLVLDTADRSSPQTVLHAIHGVDAVKELVRTHTERMRQARGVRDFEINPQ